ncbi:LysR family transcriptional regulator [Saccharomonospora xinjiangensis]|uniref:LysR family transcriptional regulator n=1 Tax=Saccharomonospora xinjiangensis TaxID=75294 RepID=UPI0010701405|nr:LysR substrate-binding domain-containing protein [Saccharomonospora xinjiangensis]
MDLVHALRSFVVVADERHFGRAADRLGIAQPPLSRRIARLEAELGARLFDRDSRRVELTEAGHVLLAEARDVLARWDRMITLVGKAHRGETDTVRAGVPPEVPGRVLAAILRAFADVCPGVRLDLQELTTAEQLPLLADRQLDTGLLHHPVDTVDLRLGPVVETPLGVVLPRTDPLAARTELALPDLAGHGLVLFPRAAAPGRYDETLRTCWEHGFRPTTVHHARNPEFVLGLVLAGSGVAFDSGGVARKEPRVVWRPLRPEPLTWRMSFAWPATSPHPLAPRLAEVATEVLRSDGVSTVVPPGSVQPPRPWEVVYASGAGAVSPLAQ